MTSDSYPGPSGSGSLADTLTLDELGELCSAQGRGEFKAWLLGEARAGRLSVLQCEVPVPNSAMVRKFKLRDSFATGRPHDTDLFGRSLSVMRPKPAASTRTTLTATEYRFTKHAVCSVAPAILAKGWWSDDLQRWTGVDPRPAPEVLSSADIEKRLTVYNKTGGVVTWKHVWRQISSKHPAAKVSHGRYEISRVEGAIAALGYTCETGGLAKGMPRTTGASSVFNIVPKTVANKR